MRHYKDMNIAEDSAHLVRLLGIGDIRGNKVGRGAVFKITDYSQSVGTWVNSIFRVTLM